MNGAMKLSRVDMNALVTLPNPKLRNYLHLQELGQPDEYRTPFYDGKPVSEVVGEWHDYCSKKLRSDYPKLVGLIQFEDDMFSKVGPLSIQQPLKERMDDIEDYYTGVQLPSVPLRADAISAVSELFKSSGGMMRMTSEKTAIELMKKSTNSGTPYFTKRREALKLSKGFRITPSAQVINGREYSLSAVLGWRGQEGGPSARDVKQRVLWMFPMCVNIKEAQVYNPLIKRGQNGVVPGWISNEYVDGMITHLLMDKEDHQLVIATDFTGYDQHFNHDMQNAAQMVLKNTFTDCWEWLETIYPIKYDIPLLIQWGKITTGKHGMASGSGGTNADETLAHMVLQHEVALNHKKRLSQGSMCLGDDGVISYPGIKLDDVIEAYTSHGLVMNPDKQSISPSECVYLRRWHSKLWLVNGVCAGVYATCRALGRLCEQERYYEGWSKEMVALRQISILENVKYHPLREDFVEYCMRGDKYRLGIDIPGFLDNIAHIAKEANEKLQSFMSY